MSNYGPAYMHIHIYPQVCFLSYESESEAARFCLTLCNSMDYCLPGSSLHGIFQARELVGLPFPSPGDLPDPEIKPRSPSLQADVLLSEPPGKPITLFFCSISVLFFY